MNTVYSNERTLLSPRLDLPPQLVPNTRLQMDGRHFLALLPAESIPVAFLDPQYRGVLDKLGYGNEGETRGKQRSALMQMSESDIAKFVCGIDRALIPSGHLFLWMDKFHLCQGFTQWLCDTRLEVVDMIVWDKGRMGMGYRTRRQSEYCVVLQKQPKRAKGVWQAHDIPDVWREKKPRGAFTHQKPLRLQSALIAAVSAAGDMIMDPAAGSYSVMQAAHESGRNFIGCDIVG